MPLRSLMMATLCAAIVACGDGRETTSPPEEAETSSTERLDALVEGYFEEFLVLNPVYATFIGDNRFNDSFANSIGPEHRETSLDLDRRYLEALREIDSEGLAGQDRLTYMTFERDREEAIEAARYPSHLIPVNQFFSVPNMFAQMGSGQGVHPFRTVDDYDDFLSRIDGFVVWIDQAIINMKEGVERGVVQPRVLMEKTLPQLEAHVVEDPESSLFFGPVRNFPEDLPEEERARLTQAYTRAISEQVVPAYQRLHAFVRDEYLPRTRETIGLSALPDGEAWYAFLVRVTTTTDLSPDAIHRIGLDEVARIRSEMEKVRETVGFEGDLDAFFESLKEDERFYFDEKEQLLDGYRDLRERVHASALDLFEALPEADYEIRAVEPFREQSASGASYQGASPDGTRPGVFYVNTYDLSARPKFAMESLFLHEAVPGHHFQIASQMELEELPRFRRFGGYTAYTEGWGLYAESLGPDLGLYEDPYQRFGALDAELWRAIRLVVDTGIHSKGWTRQQVLDYMYANSAVQEARAVSEAERYIAIPSQALAYKVGQLKITELRRRAEAKLGEDFDVKEFHALILRDGALPLDILEQKVDRWLSGVRIPA